MKANPRARPVGPVAGALGPPLTTVVATVLASALVSGCVTPPATTPPAQHPVDAIAAASLPAPSAPPGWRDAPITPGVWRWSKEGGTSVARFADGVLVLRCDRAARTVALLRAGSAAETVPMSIDTASLSRPLSGIPLAGPPPMVAVTFAADDPLLDAMAFSRGRFALEAAGMPTLLVPSWPEVSRVIEDCR